MSDSAEEQLKTTLEREQKHFETLVSDTDIESFKSKLMQKVNNQINADEPSDRNKHLSTPTYFAIAATIVLSVSILLYTQLVPTQLPLISQKDVNAENQYIASLTKEQLLSLEAVEMSIDPEFPIITLEKPKDIKNITSPFAFKLSFEASPNSEIDAKSFQLTYGLLNADITERILRSSKIKSNQLNIKKMSLPSGQHLLTVRIADLKGRTSKARYKLVVMQ